MDALPVSIRLNPFKGPNGPEGKTVPWSPWGRILDSRPQFIMDPLMHAGCYYVQDSSAMFPGHIFRRELRRLGSPRGVRVLDLCAAPGGKTTDLAASLREACGSDFTLVSNEVMRARAAVLVQNAAVWGEPSVKVVSADPSVFGRLLPGCFDIILADVPCSGEGMFRKDARAREEWSPAVVDLCAARQRRILADVWPALREGGILIYSTCTYEDAENDANLRWAADTLGGTLLSPEEGFGQYGVRTTDCGNLLKAGEVPGEGQWAGALVKTAAARPPRRIDMSVLKPLWDGSAPPDSDAPLGILFDRNKYACAEVDLPTALRFLHRDSIVLPDAPLGYNVICYKGHPLGLVKNVGRRCNNLLPPGRRILKDV